MIGSIQVLAVLAAAPPAAGGCAKARSFYESLELDRAIEAAEIGLTRDPARPTACLEVKALALLVLGQLDDATATLQELFTRAPDYAIEDPSLSPAMLDSIEGVRRHVEALSATVRARWLIHESLRIDVVLTGGLRGASRVRFTAVVEPGDEVHHGEGPLVGRVATATVPVLQATEVHRLRVSGVVVTASGQVIHEFAADVPLVGRPDPREPETVIVTVDSGGVGWPVWAGIGAATVGAVVAIIVLSQPRLPDTAGTVGRVEVDP